ncbi:restriction endonuclease subunit S [Flavobacterium sp. MR2016-29]|uniref:restriction endonuclease subunit S n=1 Tax=Flavobacterium sp. MR2016-29 TaxID=2783795 RepID=UPI00188CC60D|nr:restriction endonuclease subunit S [Flavobacterium sp. MR2016-29]MBF4491488.1 restriction endonuclease subunit S [Flavobacterium sp. MR2016-29]
MNLKNKLPKGWIDAKLSDMVIDPKSDFVDGPFGSNLKADEYQDSGIPLFRIQNIKAGYFLDKNIKYISKEKAETIKRHSFKLGDIIITKLGEPLGLCCKVPAKYPFGIIVADLMRVRPSSEIINTDYLVYAINSKIIQDQFKSITKGTTRSRVNLTIVRDIIIPIAPINEQNKIVSKLDELFSDIVKVKEELDKALIELTTFRKVILKHAFEGRLTEKWRKKQEKINTCDELINEINKCKRIEFTNQIKEYDLGNIKIRPKEPSDIIPQKKGSSRNTSSIPLNWLRISLNDLTSKITDGTHHTPEYVKEGIHFISVKDIYDGEVHFNKTKFITKETHEELIKRCNPEPNDVLITKSGTIGRIAIVPYEPNFSLFVSVALIKPFKTLINSKYLKYILQDYVNSIDIKQDIKGGIIKNFHLEDIRKVNIPYCSTSEQLEIVNEIEDKLSLVNEIEKNVQIGLLQVDSIRRSLLQNAFEGKLVNQNDSDEHAKLLIEKIYELRSIFLKEDKDKKKTKNLESVKVKKMGKTLRNILEILQDNNEPISSKNLWQSSIYKDDIEKFYAELKKHFEKGEISEIPRDGKESFIKLEK